MKIYKEGKELLKRFTTEEIELDNGLTFNTGEVLRMCNFYSASKHLSGQRDGIGRYRPFYNIVNFRVQVAKVATDLDIKDVQISSDSPQFWIQSMLLQKESYEWMKASNFSQRLNEQGQIRPKYGGVWVKKRLEKGELFIDTVRWKNFACDQVSPDGVKLERHYMTPVELMQKKGVWDNVKEATEYALKKGKEGQRDTEVYTLDRIEVWEIHGMFSKAHLKEAKGEKFDEEDKWVYSNQVYFMLACDDKYVLYAEEEDESPYMYLPWEEVDGRMLGRGVIEEAEEAQVWTNDAVINQKNATDLASRVVMKTNAKNLANNILEVDNGKVFELNDNEDINPVNMAPSALGFLDAQIQMWERQANNATSVYESNTGEQAPSGTPYSQTALMNQVASKPFDYRREEHGIFLTQIFEKWVIPYLIKKLKKEHILVSDFTDEELDIIDEDFANFESRSFTKQLLLQGIAPTPEAIEELKEKRRMDLRKHGRKRYIKIPEGYFDGIEAKVTVITSGEQRNKAAVLTSLSSILQTVSASFNPQTGGFSILEDPTLSRIFGQIVEIAGAGISPVALRGKTNTAPVAQAPQVAPMEAEVPEALTV